MLTLLCHVCSVGAGEPSSDVSMTDAEKDVSSSSPVK